MEEKRRSEGEVLRKWEEKCSKWGIPTNTMEYDLYKQEGIDWSSDADLYCRKFLTGAEKERFMKVSISDLDYFCILHPQTSWLRDMLADALVFFKLHKRWEIYICPSPKCLCWFEDDVSFILHLTREHHHAWPFLPCNPTEGQQFAKDLRDMVWRSIDVEFNSGLGMDSLGTSEWPLLEDANRFKLLKELQNDFDVLLNSQKKYSFPVLSNGCLRALLAEASEDEKSLSCFVKLIKEMHNFVKDETSQIGELEGSEDSDIDRTRTYFDAVSIPDGSDHFLLDGLCCEGEEGIGPWLVKAPLFPAIKKVPAGASAILHLAKIKAELISECLRTVCIQPDFKTFGLTSCLGLWNMGHQPTSQIDTAPSELAASSELNVAAVNHIRPSSSHSAKRQRTASDSEMMQHHLELVKLTFELQFLESQACRLCAVDLRMYILPLLKSFLRMKLYVFMGREYGSWMTDVQEEDADSCDTMEGSAEEHLKVLVHNTVKGEPGAEVGSDVLSGYLGSCNKTEESSHAPLEFGSGSSSADGMSKLDRMAIDGGESQCASVKTAMNSRASAVTSVDDPESEPEDVLVIDAEHEAKTEPESPVEAICEILEDFELYSDIEMYSDVDNISYESEDESQNESEYGDPTLSEVMQYVRETRALETKNTGLFVQMKIADVVKYCLELSRLCDAQDMWGWRTNQTSKYWRCFDCNMRFPDEKSHMAHMESVHLLGLPWYDYNLASSHVGHGSLGVNEVVKEQTLSLDDSVKVDHTFSTFLVEMAKFRPSHQDEGHEVLQMRNLFECRVQDIQRRLLRLKDLIDTKHRPCYIFETVELDAEIVEEFAGLRMLKQELSDLCVCDSKSNLLAPIKAFLLHYNLMDDALRSWACERLEVVIKSVRCSYLPNSFSVDLESPGKVIINIMQYSGGFRFAYTGLSWKFHGKVPTKETAEIKGSYVYTGVSDTPGGFVGDDRVVLENCKGTLNKIMFRIRMKIAWSFHLDLHEKLGLFQADFMRRWQGDKREERLEEPHNVS